MRITDSSYRPLSDWSPQFILADDEAACGVVSNGWTSFKDEVYGYKIQYPASWYVYPADGALGSVTTFQHLIVNLPAFRPPPPRIEVGVAIYNRDMTVPLINWVTIPVELSARVVISPDRPSLLTDGMGSAVL